MNTEDLLAVLYARLEGIVRRSEERAVPINASDLQAVATALLGVVSMQMVDRLDTIVERLDSLKGL